MCVTLSVEPVAGASGSVFHFVPMCLCAFVPGSHGPNCVLMLGQPICLFFTVTGALRSS